jgi:hypothetical protein
MTPTEHLICWIASLLALALVFGGLVSRFRDARIRQKRRRNYRRVATTTKRPMVMLSVKTRTR